MRVVAGDIPVCAGAAGVSETPADREERIRERARRIWRELGQPTGQDVEIWQEAERQIGLDEDTRPDPPPARGGMG